jgi:hypothetical protein
MNARRLPACASRRPRPPCSQPPRSGGADDPRRPVRRHRPPGVPARARRAAADRRDPPPHPNDFAWTGTIDRLTGSDRVRRAVAEGTMPALLEDWDREAAAFRDGRDALPPLPLSRRARGGAAGRGGRVRRAPSPRAAAPRHRPSTTNTTAVRRTVNRPVAASTRARAPPVRPVRGPVARGGARTPFPPPRGIVTRAPAPDTLTR